MVDKHEGMARMRMKYGSALFRSARLGLLACVLATAAPQSARAESSAESRAAAEALFQEAGKLFKAGRYAEACSKLADSQRLDPASGTLMNLARCYEKIGKTASAWLSYLDAAAAAKNANQAERERAARDAVARLVPTLPKLSIQVAAKTPTSGFEVKRDGEVVPRTLWNVASPVDPGDHEIVANASGKKPWSRRIHLDPAQQASITVPTLEDAPVAAPTAATAGTGAPPGGSGQAGKGDDHGASHGLGASRVLGLVAGGVGLVGIGVGSFFGLQAISDKNAIYENNRCIGSQCTPEGLDYRDKAQNKATISNIAFAVGGGALVAGAILWLTAPSMSGPERGQSWHGLNVAVAPPMNNGSGELLLTGVW